MSTDLRRSVALAYKDPAAGLRAIERAWCERSLSAFVEAAWPVLEPGRQYYGGWATDAICEHLEAASKGYLPRLVITVPPGFRKSLTTSVFWPAWLWGPRNEPSKRIVSITHKEPLTIRDALKMRRLVLSDWYQGHWGSRVQLTADQSAKGRYETTATGLRLATTMRGITGDRGDVTICDDILSVKDANYDVAIDTAETWVRESLPSRVTDEDSVIVFIMQRLHEKDPAAVAIEMGYEHLCIPMWYEPKMHCVTSIGWEDPRQEEGELAWPEFFSEKRVKKLTAGMTEYAIAAQYQQSPEVRGGNIFKRDWWRKWDRVSLPHFDIAVASLDTAFSETEKDDFSALVVLGSYTDASFMQHTMVLFAWEKRLDVHDLAKEVDAACEYWNVDLLLIENSAAGKPVQQELRRMFARKRYAVRLDNLPKLGKEARAHSIAPFIADGTVTLRCDPVDEDGKKVDERDALDWQWKPHAQKLIDRCAKFPRDDHDDMVDAFVNGIRHLRKTGSIVRREEHDEDEEDLKRLPKQLKPLYPGVA